ncbi:MAG TPA: hypothetical protein VLA72_05540 [Anaerolineales bacterium]|nr:hypothetical protein [Anaerolineales bacterium]
MKKIINCCILVLMLLTACAPQTPTEPTSSLFIEQPESGTAPDKSGLTPVESVVAKQLSDNLDFDIKDITVVKNEVVEFNDGCLGVSMPEAMCAQVITPGRIIELEANGLQYEYHVSEDGSRIQPATLALTWSREGGFAGFCDRLTVFLSGEVYGSQCKGDGRMSTFSSLLSAKELDQFSTWMAKHGTVTLDASDPKGTADGMSLVIEFYGMGKGKPGKPVQQEIFIWAQETFHKLYK